MRLPDFLIIGAMKAGTTSLYRDMLVNSAVFMPTEKEPADLLTDGVRTPAGRRAYARHFERAKPDQICGEASTGYTKLPDLPGVPERAMRVLGDRLKVIYVVREPVSRIISQHHHERISGKIACGIDEAVRRYSRFVDYSRYAMQITPWLETLGPQQALIVHFETYVKDRLETVATVSRFLGIEPNCDPIRADVAYNRSEGKPVPKGPLARVRTNPLYRSLVRPMLSASAREKLRTILLPKSSRHSDTPSLETVRYISDQVEDDAQRLRVIMGRDTPLWDLNEILRRYDT